MRPTPGKASSQRVRVLFVNTRSALGADVAVHVTLMQHFDPERVEVHVATNRNASDLDKMLGILRAVPGLRFVVCDLGREISKQGGGKLGKVLGGLRNLGALASLLRLAWYVRTRRIDVLHTTDRPRDALFTTLLAKLTGRASVIHTHIKWYPEIGRLTNWGLRECTGILAISQFTRSSLIEGGYPAAKIGTVLNAIAPVLFDPRKTKRGRIRRRFGLDDSAPVIGIVARIMVWKGHRELVEALAKVKQAVPEVRLFVVGVEDTLAAQSAESYAGQVRARVSELGLEENVIWAGWLEDVPAVMADLDVLAIPSWEEPFGLVVAEAMAMERPVVGFCSGALPEIITNGEEGLLVPARDVEALADALIRLLTDPCRRAEMGRKGRARVLQQFTPARQVAEVEQFYRTLITEGRSEKERI